MEPTLPYRTRLTPTATNHGELPYSSAATSAWLQYGVKWLHGGALASQVMFLVRLCLVFVFRSNFVDFRSRNWINL